MQISIIGTGNMGTAIAKNFKAAGNEVTTIGHDQVVKEFGELVVFAVPFEAEAGLADQYKHLLAGKIVVDISNPLNFTTWDELEVPSNSSAAALLQKELPAAKVLKAFNTTFAGTLTAGKVGATPTTVLVAGDDEEAKQTFMKTLDGSSLRVKDAGLLKRAREVEAMGFLQMTLPNLKQITWMGGVGVNA